MNASAAIPSFCDGEDSRIFVLLVELEHMGVGAAQREKLREFAEVAAGATLCVHHWTQIAKRVCAILAMGSHVQ